MASACVLENHFNAPISRPIDCPAAAIAIAIAIAGCKLAGVCKIDVRASVLPAAPPGCSGRIRPRLPVDHDPAVLHRTWSAVTSCSFAMIGGIACAIAQEGNTALFSSTERGNRPAPQRYILWHAVYMWLVGSGAVASSLHDLPETSVAVWGLRMRGSEMGAIAGIRRRWSGRATSPAWPLGVLT